VLATLTSEVQDARPGEADVASTSKQGSIEFFLLLVLMMLIGLLVYTSM
jgi:hypothetical protein